jgi:hypothetical protein
MGQVAAPPAELVEGWVAAEICNEPTSSPTEATLASTKAAGSASSSFIVTVGS